VVARVRAATLVSVPQADSAGRPAGTARDEVLARIRAAIGADGRAGPQGRPDGANPGVGNERRPDGADRDAGTERRPDDANGGGAGERPAGYRTRGDLGGERLLDLLADRLTDYRAAVRRAAPAELAAAVAAALADRGARRVVVPPGLDLPALPGVEVVVDDGLSAQELDALDGVITGVAVAIAETGTVVLDGSPDQGRRAITLVPDYHLCIVRAEQVVELVPEAVARLEPQAGRPLTWISGPSATSDIELSRVEGVHGPRTLELILVGPGPDQDQQRAHVPPIGRPGSRPASPASGDPASGNPAPGSASDSSAP
jgi:L-lactate dehydrogenase complex protein LldG